MERKTKVVLDSNVLISGYFWRGNENRILDLCLQKVITLVISPFIIEEVKKVMSMKFHTPTNEIDSFIHKLEAVSLITYPQGHLNFVIDDPEDRMIMDTAVLGDVDLLVTGDSDLLRKTHYGKIRIVNATKALNEIL